VGIAMTGFYHPDGILQIFLSIRSASFAATNSSSIQITSCRIISFNAGSCHHCGKYKIRSENSIQLGKTDHIDFSTGKSKKNSAHNGIPADQDPKEPCIDRFRETIEKCLDVFDHFTASRQAWKVLFRID
jgi:hypothetical protein